MTGESLAKDLEALFRRAGGAHHQAFIEQDGGDPEWPLWYADYLLGEGIGTLLEATLTKSELVYLLVLAAKEQALVAPGADWARYYARFFVERYG